MRNIKVARQCVLTVVIAFMFGACSFEFEVPGPKFVPVDSITGVPTGGVKDFPMRLERSVNPSNATNQAIEWAVKEDGGTNTAVSRGILTAARSGTVTVTARIQNGKTRTTDYVEDFQITIFDEHIRVTAIIGVPSECFEGDDVVLTGTVSPSYASNTAIVWELKDSGTTGAELEVAGGRYTLTTASPGTIVVTATVYGGGALPSQDYTQNFAIEVKAIPPPPPIIYVLGKDDSNKPFVWKDGDPISLTVTDTGVVSPNIQVCNIVSENGMVYINGYYWGSGTPDHACYWVIDEDDSVTFKKLGEGTTGSIAVLGGVVYVSGGYYDEIENKTFPCYWKGDGDGVPIKTQYNLPGGVESGIANNIAIDGGDIYLAVELFDVSKSSCAVWKNGSELRTWNDFYINDIAVHNGVVYAVGYDSGHKACYYENGTKRTISNIPSGADYSQIYNIVFADGKLYMAGEYSLSSTNYIWYSADGSYNQISSYYQGMAVFREGVYLLIQYGSANQFYYRTPEGSNVNLSFSTDLCGIAAVRRLR